MNPKNMEELIFVLLTRPGPRDRMAPAMREALTEYLANGFCTCIAENPQCADILQRLFEDLTRVNGGTNGPTK